VIVEIAMPGVQWGDVISNLLDNHVHHKSSVFA
jgi:hypothetical protein